MVETVKGPVRTALFAATLLASAVSRPAFAQPTDADLLAARQIFAHGKDLEKANDWAGALADFKKVAEVKTTPQVRYHIGLCEENLGHLVAAINSYEQGINEAKQPGAKAEDVLENAPPRVEALRAKVPKIHLTVSGEVLYSKVMLDKAAVPQALFNTDISVDPGAHELEIDTNGKTSKHKKITLAERESTNVHFDIHDEPLPEPTVAPPPTDTAKPPPEPTVNRTPVWIAAGVGVAGFVAAGIFFTIKSIDVQRVSDSCTGPNNNKCDPSFEPIAQEAQTMATLSAVGAGVGAAGLVTAGVLYFTIKPKKQAAPAKGTTVQVLPTPLGLHVTGTF